MKVELREHGSHVGSEYVHSWSRAIQPLPQPRESVEDDDGTPIYTRRYGKAEQAAATPRAMGRLRHVYADAIEYAGMGTRTDGLALVMAVILGLPLALGGAWAGLSGMPYSGSSGLEVLFILGMSGIVAWMGVSFFSGEVDGLFFTLEERPVGFDRKHRKVYRLLPEAGTGFWNVVWRRPLVACEYDWDLVDAECRTRASTMAHKGDDCSLIFRVRKRDEYDRMIDSFSIDVRALERGNLDAMWEHIRRYMEEDGPALPDPAEALLRPVAPSWWACLRLQGEHAPLFLTHWRESPVASFFFLLLSPVSLPLRVVWGTGDYLKWKTRIPVRWPALVLERIGRPIPILPEVSGGQEAVTARRDVG